MYSQHWRSSKPWLNLRPTERLNVYTLTMVVSILTQPFKPSVKWQNTTRSWSGEPELTEGTWLQLMCCTPSRSCWVMEFTEFMMVSRSTPEKTERLEIRAMGALWSIYELILSYMIYSYMYSWEWMYLQNGKIIRRLWGTTSTITRNGT